MFCSKCGKEINDDAGFCKYCGAEIGKKISATQRKRKIILIIIAAVIFLAAVTVGLYFFTIKFNFTEKAELSVIEESQEEGEISVRKKTSEREDYHEEGILDDERESCDVEMEKTDIRDEKDFLEEAVAEAETIASKITDTSVLQANLWNWGYGCEIGEDTYINTGDTLVRISKDETGFREETVYEWRDEKIMACMDLVSDGNTIYYGGEDKETTIYYFNAFDVSERKSYRLFSYEYSNGCYILNKIENRIYYYVDGSLAYIDTNDDYRTGRISLHATAISAGQNGEICVTDSGVFCSEFGDEGLKLLSYDGVLERVYKKLSGKTINMLSERNGKLFFRFTEGDPVVYALDIKTGDYSRFTEEDIFAGMDNSRINFYEEMFFISTGRRSSDESGNDYAVYVFSEEGNLKRELELSMPGIGISGGPCLMVLNDVLYAFEPLTEYPYLGIYRLPNLGRIEH